MKNRSFPRIAGTFLSVFLYGCAAMAQTPATLPDTFPNSPFGIGCDSARSRDLTKWIPQMATLGIKTLRDPGGTGWTGKEITSWEGLDEKITYLASQGFNTGGTFYNYRQKMSGFPLDDLPGWSAYVSQIVGHAKNQIKFWEVWNEPPNGTHNSPGSDYTKLMLATYDPAKTANPGCMIGIAAKSVDVNYLDVAIAAGAKDHFDYITLHPYETLGCIMSHPGTEAVFMNIVPTVRKMLAARNPSRVNVPIIFTELGFDAKRGPEKQAYALVKAYSMGIAQGVTCINWFEAMDGDSGPMGMIQGNAVPRPAYTAMGQMIQHFGPHPVYIGWVLLNDKDYGFVFKGAKGPVMTTWAPKGETDNIDFGQPVQVINPLTGTASQAGTYALTEAPVIVDGVPAKFVTLATSNKSKPFPWGGDYTNAKSVSVTMGEKNIEKGLHTQSASSIAADVLAYGGSARAGTVPGGNVYMVDPNFLTYTSTPIEISVVVRRNPANDPAKISLEYESTDGYKKTSVYEIPDNTQWHTATWRITDSQFVSKWAFNFRMDAGKYFIQSVTVTKLGR